jgi:hypothetical protein
LDRGFELNNEKDTLLWSWDTKGGQVNAKQAYEVQLLEEVVVEPTYWYTELWQWQLPLKVKLFIWLMLEQKILTWENLVKRGIVGPSRCVLCGNNEENVRHLFVDCSFTKDIWYTIQKDLNFESIWEGGKIADCLQNWIKKKENLKKFLVIFAGRFGNIGTWLFLKIVLLIGSEFVIVFYRTWEKQKYPYLLRVVGLIGLLYLTGI